MSDSASTPTDQTEENQVSISTHKIPHWALESETGTETSITEEQHRQAQRSGEVFADPTERPFSENQVVCYLTPPR